MRRLALLLPLAAPGLAQGPVSAELALPDAMPAAGTTFDVTVNVEVEEGWHVYDLDGPAPYADTTLELSLPEGLEAVGEWREPASVAHPDGGLRVWIGSVAFAHEVRVVGPTQAGASVAATLGYQVCNEDLCHPPAEVTLTAALPRVDDPWEPHRALHVLYAGYEGGHRERVFAEFLGEHFDRVETIPLAELSMDRAKDSDVVIADWVSRYGCDGYEELENRLHSAPLDLPADFTKPVVAMTYVGTQVRGGYKLDWL